MSKSLNNGVDPLDAAEKYGADTLRYALIKELRFGNDGIISEQSIEQRLNNDLASDIGNLASRTVAMINKYRDGIVTVVTPTTERGRELRDGTALLFSSVLECTESMRLSQGFEPVLNYARDLNRYVNEVSPWNLAKSFDDSQLLDEVLYILHHGLRSLAILLMPIMPVKMKEMRAALGVEREPIAWNDEIPTAGTYKVTEQMAPLFKRASV